MVVTDESESELCAIAQTGTGAQLIEENEIEEVPRKISRPVDSSPFVDDRPGAVAPGIALLVNAATNSVCHGAATTGHAGAHDTARRQRGRYNPTLPPRRDPLLRTLCYTRCTFYALRSMLYVLRSTFYALRSTRYTFYAYILRLRSTRSTFYALYVLCGLRSTRSTFYAL